MGVRVMKFETSGSSCEHGFNMLFLRKSRSMNDLKCHYACPGFGDAIEKGQHAFEDPNQSHVAVCGVMSIFQHV